jgi:hypothetical protein
MFPNEKNANIFQQFEAVKTVRGRHIAEAGKAGILRGCGKGGLGQKLRFWQEGNRSWRLEPRQSSLRCLQGCAQKGNVRRAVTLTAGETPPCWAPATTLPPSSHHTHHLLRPGVKGPVTDRTWDAESTVPGTCRPRGQWLVTTGEQECSCCTCGRKERTEGSRKEWAVVLDVLLFPHGGGWGFHGKARQEQLRLRPPEQG